MLSSVIEGVLRRIFTTKRTPSNRASPLDVAIHKYPSGVWARARIRFSGRPSWLRQIRLTYRGACGKDCGEDCFAAQNVQLLQPIRMAARRGACKSRGARVREWRMRAFKYTICL